MGACVCQRGGVCYTEEGTSATKPPIKTLFVRSDGTHPAACPRESPRETKILKMDDDDARLLQLLYMAMQKTKGCLHERNRISKSRMRRECCPKTPEHFPRDLVTAEAQQCSPYSSHLAFLGERKRVRVDAAEQISVQQAAVHAVLCRCVDQGRSVCTRVRYEERASN